MAPDVSWIAPLQPALLAVVLAGIALLLAGFVVKGRRSSLLRSAGWVLFAVYWPFQAPEYFWPTKTTEPDPINGWFTLLGPIFLLWVAWHEWKSYRWDEDPPALRWFAGASAISAATYFAVYETPVVTKAIIYHTAVQSAWLYNWLFFGGDARATVFQDSLGESHIFLNGTDYAVTVVLACTAIQSIMIFVGAIWCLRADRRRKLWAYAATVPTIYLLNLFRNAGIVYGYKDLGWGMFGIDPFEWMHSYVGKIGSLAALIVIALAVFSLLPELHSNILDLFDLRKRRAPGFFRRPPTPDAPVAEA
ncbi:MAG TPA: archaeosortase A [Candidatus Thermoplasmatota archaeon]|nr:archaeosortase A [Candidatus Thermoplasmatota archaeon]